MERLKLILNYQVKEFCNEECSFHNYPYKAVSVINGKQIIIKNEEDLWEQIMEVYKDCEKSPSGKNKYQDLDLFDCLSFFACPNNIFCADSLSTIRRYTYCKDTKTLPYEGSYGSQPKKWVDKYFLLTSLSNLRELRVAEKQSKARNNKGVPLNGNI